MANVAQDYLTYLNNTLAIIEGAFSDRLGAINQPAAGKYDDPPQGQWYQGGTYYYVYVLDYNASKWPSHAVNTPSINVKPDNIVWYESCDTSPCGQDKINDGAAWRQSYINDLSSQLAQKYNASPDRLNDLHGAQALFQKVIDGYKQAVPPTNG